MYRMQAMPASFQSPDPGSAEEAVEKRYEGGTDEGNTAAGHELLHALGLGTGVIIAVAFEQVDCAPNTKTGTESDDERLQYAYCTVEKCHRPHRNPNPRNALFCRFFAFSKEPKTLFSLVLSFLNAYLRRWVSLLS